MAWLAFAALTLGPLLAAGKLQAWYHAGLRHYYWVRYYRHGG